MFKKLITVLFVLLFVAAAAGFAWSYTNYMSLKEKVGDAPQQLSEEEITSLLEKVSKHIVLPTEGPEPMVATIQDADTLKTEQKFFADAQNGDKLIIFKQKAIIYSEAQDKLINVGPIYLEGGGLTIDVRNGSEEAGVASGLAETLNRRIEYEILDIGDASRSDYGDFVIVNQSEKDISALEKEFGVTAVTQMPSGEDPSSADVVIIIGNNVVGELPEDTTTSETETE